MCAGLCDSWLHIPNNHKGYCTQFTEKTVLTHKTQESKILETVDNSPFIWGQLLEALNNQCKRMCLISQESHFMACSFHICPAVLTLECWTLRQTCARRVVKVIDLCVGSRLNFLSHVCVCGA